MGSRSIPVQDGKPLWQSSSLLFQCQLRVPLIKNRWSWGYTRKPQSCVMRQEESCMPEFTPTGKWTDLQSDLTCNRRYVNVLQDDNKNRKKLQTIAWVAILRQKLLYLSIQFFLKIEAFCPLPEKGYHHLNEKKNRNDLLGINGPLDKPKGVSHYISTKQNYISVIISLYHCT